MLEIRKAIKQNILPSGVSVKVRYDNARAGDPFPYIVFSFDPIVVQDESTEKFILNVDGWDEPMNGDSVPLETLMKQIDGNGELDNPSGLNKKVIHTDEVTLILSRELRYSIPDKNKRLKRIRYTYQVLALERR